MGRLNRVRRSTGTEGPPDRPLPGRDVPLRPTWRHICLCHYSHSCVGLLWDFPGTFGCIKRYEGERRERRFSQVRDLASRVCAAHRAAGSFPGHLSTPRTDAVAACPACRSAGRAGVRRHLSEISGLRSAADTPRTLGGCNPSAPTLWLSGVSAEVGSFQGKVSGKALCVVSDPHGNHRPCGLRRARIRLSRPTA